MGNFLNTSSIRTILDRVKEWVRSRIYKETIIITDENYRDYITSEVPNGIISKEFDIKDYNDNIVDRKTFTIVDFAILKFPIGTRNIIFDVKYVNFHRLVLVPDTLDKSCYGENTDSTSVDKWRKYNGYKLNLTKHINNGTFFGDSYEDSYYNYYASSDNNESQRINSLLYLSEPNEGLGGLLNCTSDFKLGKYFNNSNSAPTCKIYYSQKINNNPLESNREYDDSNVTLYISSAPIKQFTSIEEEFDDKVTDVWGSTNVHPISKGYGEKIVAGCKIFSNCRQSTELLLINGKWTYFV